MSERAGGEAPMFSVVITTHNRPQFLKEAMASVVAQSVADFELLVVDDGSIPSAQPSEPDPRIRVIRRESAGGPAASRNEGMRASRGKYLVFLDDDDLFLADRLALGKSGVAEATVSICLATTLDQRARPWVVDLRRLLRASSRIRAADKRTPAGSPQLLPQVGQVTILAEVAPEFDERLLVEEDVDWWIAVSRIESPKVVEQPGYIRRIHDRPRERSEEDLTRALEATQLVLEKNASFFADHPGAAAARWRRVGLFNERLGRRSEARQAFKLAAALAGRRIHKTDIARTYLPIPAKMRTRI
jgi:glycosyltransferase involved in cell wall biosynthesis